jgi:hypothetical protein
MVFITDATKSARVSWNVNRRAHSVHRWNDEHLVRDVRDVGAAVVADHVSVVVVVTLAGWIARGDRGEHGRRRRRRYVGHGVCVDEL